MKELAFYITFYDIKEIEDEDIASVREYLEGIFPHNKGIAHSIKELPDYAKIFEFLRTYMDKKKAEDRILDQVL